MGFRNANRQFERVEWNQLKRFYKNRCVRCSKRESAENPLQPDHVIPVAMGGSKNIGNIQPLCDACNKWKADQIVKGGKILDWRQRRFKN